MVQIEDDSSGFSLASAPPPPRWDKSLGGASSTDQLKTRVLDTPKLLKLDNKVATLEAYHKARGLLKFCVEKWVHGHHCAPTIQLQIVQELWEMLHGDLEIDSNS
jgi:hypothetical protein